MDRTYKYDKTRKIIKLKYSIPNVPPKKNRKNHWEYDGELYKLQTRVEKFNFFKHI